VLPRAALLMLGLASLALPLTRSLRSAVELWHGDTRDQVAAVLSRDGGCRRRLALLGLPNGVFGPDCGRPVPLARRPDRTWMLARGFELAVLTSNQVERFLERPEAAPRRTRFLRRLLAELARSGGLILQVEPSPWRRAGPTVWLFELFPGPRGPTHIRRLELADFDRRQGRRSESGVLVGGLRPGIFADSPLLWLEPGSYRWISLIAAADAGTGAPLGRLEVWDPIDRRPRARATLFAQTLGPTGSAAVPLCFELDRATPVRLRAGSRGRVALRLLAGWIERTDPEAAPPPLPFECELSLLPFVQLELGGLNDAVAGRLDSVRARRQQQPLPLAPDVGIGVAVLGVR
jgi:hypothetical protein